MQAPPKALLQSPFGSPKTMRNLAEMQLEKTSQSPDLAMTRSRANNQSMTSLHGSNANTALGTSYKKSNKVMTGRAKL